MTLGALPITEDTVVMISLVDRPLPGLVADGLAIGVLGVTLL